MPLLRAPDAGSRGSLRTASTVRCTAREPSRCRFPVPPQRWQVTKPPAGAPDVAAAALAPLSWHPKRALCALAQVDTGPVPSQVNTRDFRCFGLSGV